MEWRERSLLTRLLTVLLSTVAPFAAAYAQNYGKVGAVNPDATGVMPGGETQKLTVGANVVHKERIQTSSQGKAQIQFPDQSTLNVGPNSSIVIDEFVYDPDTRTGSMVTSMTKGALRFVGGQITHTAGASINTPIATLGIRGGIVTIMLPVPPSIVATDPRLAGQGQLVIAHHGAATLTNGAGALTLRPGFAVIVGSNNQPIGQPFRPSNKTLQAILHSLTSHTGESGGVGSAHAPHSNTFAGPGTTNGNTHSNTGAPGSPGTQTGNNGAPGSDPLGYTSIFGAGNNAATGRSQSGQSQTATPPKPYP